MSADIDHATQEQADVIGLPAAARAFVVAGPGTGKTWTLLRRARMLIGRDGLGASDLLVLSFTRAVVRELRRRDSDTNGFTTMLPETFDSFATRLLAQHSVDEGWASRGFDDRIALATQLIEDGSARETLERVEHVLVDEVQDLVGVRADFVHALLVAHKRGFSAFGDPAQAIYDHERGRSGANFCAVLEERLADELHPLTTNHRAGGDLARMTESVRAALLDSDEDVAANVTEDAYRGLHSLGSFQDVPYDVSDLQGDVAVLCRDNATALLLSRALHENGISHRVRRGTADRPVAGWLAAVFDGSPRLSRDRFAERLDELNALGMPGVPDLDQGWSLLGRLDPGGRRGAVRASEIGSRLAAGRVPYDLIDELPDPLIVSSIHRAKGLEFDACAIVEWPRREEEDVGLESRILFVALSRARRDCVHVGRRKARAPWFRAAEAQDRLVKRGRESWQTFGIEVRGDDVHSVDPGGTIGIDESASEVQRRLVEWVRPGDSVGLESIGRIDLGGGACPVYAVRHDAGYLGITGMRFGAALRRRLGDAAPQRIEEVRIDDLESVKGDVATGDAAGLGRSGLWLRPRLVGLGEFRWKGA